MKTRTRVAIIAQRRSGSTMLCYGLSNHPEVHCARGEPLHRKSSWRWAFGGAGTPWGRRVYQQIFGLALSQWGYQASVAKVNWGRGTEEVWDWLATVDGPPVRGIYLRRENLLREAVSEIIRCTTKVTTRPRVHEPDPDAEPLPMTAGDVLGLMAFLEAEDARATAVLDDRSIPYVALTYADLIGREGREVVSITREASHRLCDWLKVERRDLIVWPKRRVNPHPLARLVKGWPEVQAAVADSKWAAFLEDEKRWN